MKKSGFTLVEVMFVVAIIGLLAALGVPAILNSITRSEEKAREAHIAAIEKAKGMLQLPQIIYENGRSLTNGAAYGEGDYTETALMQCVQNANQLADLDVGDYSLVPGAVGEKAGYVAKSLLAAAE